MHKNAYFNWKIAKTAQRWGSAPRPPMSLVGGGSTPANLLPPIEKSRIRHWTAALSLLHLSSWFTKVGYTLWILSTIDQNWKMDEMYDLRIVRCYDQFFLFFLFLFFTTTVLWMEECLLFTFTWRFSKTS